MNKVLITGANGFVGKNLIKSLKGKYEIYGIDRVYIESLDDSHSIVCDISDFNRIHEVFERIKPNVLIHLAAIVHKNNADTSEKNYDLINFLCSKNLFDECKKYNTYVIFSSTIEVYGDVKERVISENIIHKPTSYYAKSKSKAEENLQDMKYNNFTILQFAAVYGENFTLNIDKRIFIGKRIAYYFKNGNYTFNFCSIKNVITSIEYLLNNKQVGETFIISDKESKSAKQLISLFRKQNIKCVLRLPYYPCHLIIKLLNISNKKHKNEDRFLSEKNFNKLFESKIYNNNKFNQICNLNWNIESTLFGEDV